MIINLTDPFWRTLIAGLILMIIGGAYHYIRTLVELNFTKKKIGNILTEMDSLHKDYKNQISKIKEKDNRKIKDLLEHYDKQLNEIYKKNLPRGRQLAPYDELFPKQ